MKRVVLVIALGLAGCSTLTNIAGTTVSPSQVVIAGNSFDALEATATNYLRLPTCPVQAPVCKNSASVGPIVSAVHAGRTARTDMIGYVTANPGQAVPVSRYDTLKASVDSLNTLFAQYNVKG